MTHNIFTSMIGFVTWPPFLIVYRYEKGGQVTKPIILVKICYNIVCHLRSYNYFDKVTSWPQLISNILVTPAYLQCCF